MNWANIGLLTLAFLIMLIGYFRAERRARIISLILFIFPVSYFIWIWVSYNGERTEMWIALAAAALLYFLWHGFYGHRLPPPSSDNIKVWGQDD
ncbi:MAG: hypothetical protein ACE5FI_05590 [Anaerolineales bacterium]